MSKTILTITTLLTALTMLFVAPVLAQSTNQIVDSIEEDGLYVDRTISRSDANSIDEANSNGTAFVWLSKTTGGESVAETIAEEILFTLNARNTKYEHLIVILDDAMAIDSNTMSDISIDRALEATLSSFRNGDISEGLSSYITQLNIETGGITTSSNSSSQNTSNQSSGSSENKGISIMPILLTAGIFGGGFLLFKSWRSKKKFAANQKASIEQDRAEIHEQLQNNADRVIKLGDRVIASDSAELMRTYEEASKTYQHVSQQVDNTHSAEEIDALDDQIDHAEWQLESIEAQLEGKPVPESPQELERKAVREAQERKVDQRGRRTNRSQSRQRQSGGIPGLGGSRGRGGRRSSMGGGLGGLLGSILMGGLGGGRSRGRNTSRRTNRRTSGSLGSNGNIFGGSRKKNTGRGNIFSGGKKIGGRKTRSFGKKSGGGKGRNF